MLSPSHNIAHTFLLILEASLKKMYSDACTLEPQWWFVTEHGQTMISLLSWSVIAEVTLAKIVDVVTKIFLYKGFLSDHTFRGKEYCQPGDTNLTMKFKRFHSAKVQSLFINTVITTSYSEIKSWIQMSGRPVALPESLTILNFIMSQSI